MKKIAKNILKVIRDLKTAIIIAICKRELLAKRHFLGNLFERFSGLEQVVADINGKSVLDIGCCEGLISYEMARNGAALVHGFDIDKVNIVFANRLFRDVPIASVFRRYNFSKGSMAFNKRFEVSLLKRYDIVLFLGIYHHLKRQMSNETLRSLVEYLLEKTGDVFVVRTNLMEEVDNIIIPRGFLRVYSPPKHPTVGLLNVYRRKEIT